ncbi:5'-3'-deoxyribonucleotidase [Mucilaginibacter gynuensis]|uniref:5'-3'-deoxyribonucleotidase n=1 Tax=Mucilaginibacter gynuensis TaxID=1302236 RepID=A0ABP8G4W5_9SPHI
MKRSVAIDMDGVLADVESHFFEWYKRDYGVSLTLQDIIGKTEDDAFPEKMVIRKFATTPGFFTTVPVMPGAIEAVKKLMEDFEVYVVSAAMEFPQSLSEKRIWLTEHFPFISWRNIIFCGDKSIISTDFMIDDHIKNLDYFKGKTILFNAFHNVSYHHHTRANNWDEVLALMQESLL